MAKVEFKYREEEDPTTVPEDAEETPTGGVQLTGEENEDPTGEPEEDEEGDEEDSGDDRPEWLPEKFKTPADLAKAYREMEKRLGKEGSEKGEKKSDVLKIDKESDKPSTKEAREVAEEAGLDFDALAQEYMENGELSAETYESLESKGISRRSVDTHIRGLQAIAQQVRSRVAGVVGGEETLPKVLEWAKSNLTEQEIDFFNDAVKSGNEAAATLAMRGIFAQYTDKNGVEPDLINDETAPVNGGVQPYESLEDYVEDVQNPKYKTSAKFRKQVERRLEASDGW